MFLFYKIYFYVIAQFGHVFYWFFVKFQQVCKGMINNIGIQLFAILDQANGTVSAKDICGMVIWFLYLHKFTKLVWKMYKNIH